MRSKNLKRSILKILGDGKSYGYDVHKKLMREGVRIEISRLYRVLNEMLKENYVTGRWEKSVIDRPAPNVETSLDRIPKTNYASSYSTVTTEPAL